MKTVEEIIKGLECCRLDGCTGCPYDSVPDCGDQVERDALELIRRLTGKSDGAVILEKDTVLQRLEPHDTVNHPSHYTQGGVECIDALKAATTGLEGIEAVCTANAIKYLWRWKQKNGAEDLRKAVWYINRLLEETP